MFDVCMYRSFGESMHRCLGTWAKNGLMNMCESAVMLGRMFVKGKENCSYEKLGK